MDQDNFSKDNTDLEMRTRLIKMYPVASDKRLDMLNQLNKALAPIAICQAKPNVSHPSYDIIALTINKYINPVCFEYSDAFYALLQDISMDVFEMDAKDVINWNNTKSTFWFIDNLRF